MADIVASSQKKINIFDRVIQSVVIMVNMTKMNRAIDEHLNVVNKAESEDKRVYEENILREIVFVKYQYDIMQRQMYDLRISYPDEITEKINSSDKTDRLELQRIFLEMEYDRITKIRFKSREDIKFNLLAISSAIDAVKQNIKDEGKARRYNAVIKYAEDIDTKIQTEEYTIEMYKEFFDKVSEYVDYINDNYDISKLPNDERELIEYVIETMIKSIESDIDKYLYEYNLVINICKNSYRYFKIIDKVFENLKNIYDESFEKDILNLSDYVRMYKEIYDDKIKTKVNDVHRTIKTEDEYLEYSKIASSDDEDALQTFILTRALESTDSEIIKNKISKILNIEETEDVEENTDVAIEDIEKDIELEVKEIVEENIEKEEEEEKEEKKSKVRIGLTKTIKKVGRPRKNPEEPKKEKVKKEKIKKEKTKKEKEEKVDKEEKKKSTRGRKPKVKEVEEA